jgi:polyhydroxybutyrate depolymerase
MGVSISSCRLPNRLFPRAAATAVLTGALWLTSGCPRDADSRAPALDGSPASTDVPDAPAAADVATPAPDSHAGSPGCATGATTYVAGSQMGTLTVAGRARTFRLHVPAAAADRARPLPIVLLLHGGLGTGAEIEESSLFSPIADREGIVAVYPDGLDRSWNAGRCCGQPVTQQIDDVGFIAALLDHLGNALCIDDRRVYATGMSNGALMTHRLACELSDRIAAIAPVSGTDMTTQCAPKRAVPMMEIHGSLDPHVPWDGGTGCGLVAVPFTSVPATIAAWTSRNGCMAAANTLFVDQGNGRCERQGVCPAGADVILCTIAGGNHSWPGGEAKDGDLLPGCQGGAGAQSRTFIASEQIWAFFKTHALP